MPSTRTCTRAAAADGTNTRAATRTAISLQFNESSFREGFELEADGRSSDSGLPPAPPSQPRPVASWRESVSPHSGGTVPDLHRVPQPLALCERESTIEGCG